MTNIELIRMLIKHPPDAVVFTYAEDGDYHAVTGCVAGSEVLERRLTGKVYRIELQTDKPF